MTTHPPITGQELEEMKQRLSNIKKGAEFQCYDPYLAEFLQHARVDLTRCIAEIERLQATINAFNISSL